MKKVLVYGMTNLTGGIENYIYNLTKEFRGVFQFDFLIHFESMAFEKEMRENGSQIFYIPGKGQGILTHLRAFFHFLREHREYRVIYFNVMDPMVFPTVMAARLMGRKCVVHSHNGDMMKSKVQKICRFFLNLAVNQRMSCAQCASEYLFGKRKRKQTVVIHNKIDTEKYLFDQDVRARKRRELGIEDQFVICHVGRLTHQKNPKGVIDILAETVKKDKDVILLSVGTGDMKEEVRQYAKAKHVTERIRFLGVRQDVNEIMQASDVFILPSFYEGLPIVGIEAQASGLPCLFSDCVTRETDITGNCQFLSLDDKARWADEIIRCRGMERNNQGQQVMKQGYDLKHPLDKNIIRKCLDSKREKSCGK